MNGPTSKLGQDLLNSLTGNIPKAVLFVRKYSQDTLNMQRSVAVEKSKAMEKLLLANTKTSLAGAAAGTSSYATMTTQAGLLGFCAMRVQYNPSSIYFDSTPGGMREIDSSSINHLSNNQLQQINTKAMTSLGLQLIFDDMDVMDSFMLDSSMLSTGAAFSAIAKKVGFKKTEFTVQNEVEGLIACLLSPNTRDVIFCWSDMIFSGQLFQVNANYTMFNKKGNPVRATVEITIQQEVEAETAGKGGYWDTAFTTAFGAADMNMETGGASALTKATNNALLNLNI